MPFCSSCGIRVKVGEPEKFFYCAPNHRKFRVGIDGGTVVTPRLLFSSQDDFSGDGPASFEDEYVNGSSCAPHAIERMLFIFYCKRAFVIPPRNANFVGIFGLRDRRHSGFSHAIFKCSVHLAD